MGHEWQHTQVARLEDVRGPSGQDIDVILTVRLHCAALAWLVLAPAFARIGGFRVDLHGLTDSIWAPGVAEMFPGDVEASKGFLNDLTMLWDCGSGLSEFWEEAGVPPSAQQLALPLATVCDFSITAALIRWRDALRMMPDHPVTRPLLRDLADLIADY